MPRARKSDIFLLALNNYIWGTGFVAIKYAQEQMGPVVLNLWSLGLSIPILMPFAYAEYRRKKTSSRPLGRRQYVDYFVMGILGLTGMTLLYNLGARLSLAANGALIAMSIPILTAIIAVIVLGEKMTWVRGASLAIAVVGVLIISDIEWGSVGLFGPYLVGNLLLLLGAVGNAIYVVFGKKLLSHSGPMTVLFWGQVLGFLGSIPFLFFEPFQLGETLSYTPYTWLSLLFLGTVYFSFTMVIFYRILERLDAGQIMIFAYLQPVFGVAMSAILLQENITFSMILGGLLVVGGTSLIFFEERTQTAAAG